MSQNVTFREVHKPVSLYICPRSKTLFSHRLARKACETSLWKCSLTSRVWPENKKMRCSQCWTQNVLTCNVGNIGRSIILWESLPSPTLFSDRPQSSLYSREDICILQSPARGRDLWFQMEHWSVQSHGQWVSSPSFRWEDTQVTRPLPSLPISPSQ